MEIAGNAINTARDGGGPFLLEFMTYRWLEHCGPNEDLHLSYRTKEEMDEWLANCPIRLFENKLREKNILSDRRRYVFSSRFSKRWFHAESF